MQAWLNPEAAFNLNQGCCPSAAYLSVQSLQEGDTV